MSHLPIRILISFVFICLLIITGCTPFKALTVNVPKINSYKVFPYKTVQPAIKPFYFKKSANLNSLGNSIIVNSRPIRPEAWTLDKYLENSPTRAFIIIRNDSIVYEKYCNGFNDKSTVTSFSIAKSFLNIMLGIAIERGYIKSVKQPICDFFPELDRNKLGSVTIEHLLRHTSGIGFKKASYQYYTTNITRQYNKLLNLRRQPGTQFHYDNAGSQTLGIILERAYGKDLAQILQEEIWQPCGMEYPITWSTDSRLNMQIKAFCCLNGTAIDFAKIGRLFLNNGNWDGKQVVSQQWVKESLTPDSELGGLRTEKYHWWLLPDSDGAFYAGGLYGQYILVYPKKNLIIVRFAERNFQSATDVQDFFRQVIEQL